MQAFVSGTPINEHCAQTSASRGIKWALKGWNCEPTAEFFLKSVCPHPLKSYWLNDEAIWHHHEIWYARDNEPGLVCLVSFPIFMGCTSAIIPRMYGQGACRDNCLRYIRSSYAREVWQPPLTFRDNSTSTMSAQFLLTPHWMNHVGAKTTHGLYWWEFGSWVQQPFTFHWQAWLMQFSNMQAWKES